MQGSGGRSDTPVAVLAIADAHDELTPLVELLETVAAPIDVTTDEDRALQTLERAEPRVIALAFSSVGLSLVFYLRALKRVPREQTDQWQTVLFCGRSEARRAYDLCAEGVIDDYLVTRPLYDAWQLALSVKQARERLALKRWVRDVATPPVERERASLEQCVEALEAAASEQSPDNTRLWRALADVRLAVTDLSGQLQQGVRLVERLRPTPEGLARLTSASGRPVPDSLLPAPAAPGAPAATILVIDDDEFSRSMVCRTLQAGGYRAMTADDGLDGLAVLRAEPVDLVLMDVEMPRLSGIDTTKRIRERWAATALPVIMLTGHNDEQTVLDALAAGASDFVVKPGTRAGLLAKVEQHLATRPSSRST